ncbi:MAG: acyl-CoA/acyl-ACP dehydrogenase [Syntrophobacteraceae bacterium]|nr:acyl-CoA/acyl-ACP dehydrogenase [Syntrophobacteraceae bacterium]
MDFLLPHDVQKDRDRFVQFLQHHVKPNLHQWYRDEAVPRSFIELMGREGWLGFSSSGGHIEEHAALTQAIRVEELARISPGVAVVVLVQISLGAKGVWLFGSESQKHSLLEPAIRGDLLLCLGNTEPTAGSDVASIATRADKVDGGWRLNGTKAYSTNAALSDRALITAVSDPEATRNRRLSMFVVDLSAEGIKRKKLHKAVWIPSDLTRIQLDNVFVPDEALLGDRGRGLQQVLEIFANSRLPISAMTLGNAVGAFELGVDHAEKRRAFGSPILSFQAKSFEAADLYSRMEAARLMVYKACWARDQGLDFQLEASMAKYLTVQIAREVSTWAADLFGAASVVHEHPVHKFPLDAWASSLGEGTQDIQKLIIFRGLTQLRKVAESDMS